MLVLCFSHYLAIKCDLFRCFGCADFVLQAQGLGAVITSASKLMCNPNHRCYFAVMGKTVLGLLKTGKKHLFIRVTLTIAH